MSKESCRYVIVPVASVTQEMFDNSHQTSLAANRRSLDTTLTLFKWSDPPVSTPACFNGYTQYSHAEILVELATPAWTA